MNRFVVAVLLGACGWALAAWSFWNGRQTTPSATATMLVKPGGGAARRLAASGSPVASSTRGAGTQVGAHESRSGGERQFLTLAVPAGRLRFSKAQLTAKAGELEIKFTNNSLLPHNVTIERTAGGPVIGATHTFVGGSETLVLRLKRGTYLFFCSVPEHRLLGMRGTLSVY